MQDASPQAHEGAAPPEGGAGGLPQFDLAMWPGQMAWFLIFFAIVFVLMVRVFVPRIGGTIQGLGTALYEEYLYDEQGRLRNETFEHYHLPSSMDVPTMIVEHLQTTDGANVSLSFEINATADGFDDRTRRVVNESATQLGAKSSGFE